MSYSGQTNGYQSLLNMSTFDDLSVINVGNVTVTNQLSLPYLNAKAILGTDASSNVIASNLTNGQLLIGSTNNLPVAAQVQPTALQTTVINTAGGIQIGTVQNIATTSS